MKTLAHILGNLLVATFKLAIIFAIGMLIISLSSCSTAWYGRSHDGCQQAQGFTGYGNNLKK
jgi:hypothetical protein